MEKIETWRLVHNLLALGNSVVGWSPDRVLRQRRGVRLLGGNGVVLSMESHTPNTNGPEHGDHVHSGGGLSDGAGDDRGQPESPSLSKWFTTRFGARDVIGTFLCLALIALAMLRGMDAVSSTLLTTLVAVLVVRRTENGKDR